MSPKYLNFDLEHGVYWACFIIPSCILVLSHEQVFLLSCSFLCSFSNSASPLVSNMVSVFFFSPFMFLPDNFYIVSLRHKLMLIGQRKYLLIFLDFPKSRWKTITFVQTSSNTKWNRQIFILIVWGVTQSGCCNQPVRIKSFCKVRVQDVSVKVNRTQFK